jgi:hypothetical protein
LGHAQKRPSVYVTQVATDTGIVSENDATTGAAINAQFAAPSQDILV